MTDHLEVQHSVNRYASIGGVHYRVLGPVAALSGSEPVELGGKRQRTVLALLLANANNEVSQESLVDAVWAGQPPETGVRTLQSYVSNLRRILDGTIERRGEGYCIHVEPDDLDARKFRSLVDDARQIVEADCQEASETLREALGLWTGPPYGELGYEDGLVAEAARLRAERLAAQELKFIADLSCGRHETVLPELEVQVAENPHHEGFIRLLMLALYRSGRQADALRVFGRLRERLADDLGIDPSRALQNLELDILQQDPTLDLVVAARPPSDRPAARGYELYEKITTSAIGTTYRGFQTAIGREVSVMIIDKSITESSRFIRNFPVEMQASARFDHPFLSPVYDYWRDPTQTCVVGPHYRGRSLNDRQSAMSVLEVVRLADQIASALGYLHRNGTGHGLVERASVFLDGDGNAHLSGLGLAGLIRSTTAKPSDDIYDLGRLLKSLISGTSGPQPQRELDDALARATHADPESRFQRVEDLSRALRQAVGLNVAVVPSAEPEARARNPYKGLRAFQETDASDFYGRRALVDEMVAALDAARMLTVVGPSGSGKSSAVRAGLLPALRNGAVRDSDEWLVTSMFPGTHPFEELESALLRVAVHRPSDVLEALESAPSGLIDAVTQMVGDTQEVLLVVDQFEELFTITTSDTDRRRFLEVLTTAATNPSSNVRLVLTIRADFFDLPLEVPPFAEVMRENLVTVSPPSPDGLAEAIAQPALSAGVAVEPGLVPHIIEDAGQEPGGLPLVQFALTEMFDVQEDGIFSRELYRTIGGIGGALVGRAEELFQGLTAHGKEVARQVFLRLVTVDEQVDDARRRIRQSELEKLGFDPVTLRNILDRYGSYRLLTFDRDPVSRSPTVELAHESILREWSRLRGWIDERREDLLLSRRLRLSAGEWETSGHDPSYLIRGARLDRALTFLEEGDISVSPDELSLIEASSDLRAAEVAEKEDIERRLRRRRRAAFGILAGALLVASAIGIYAISQRGDAVDNAALAHANELAAVSRGLAEDDPELAMLLALEAIDELSAIGQTPTPESLSALWDAYTKHRIELTFTGTGAEAAAFSPDGSVLATDLGADPRQVALWNPETGDRIGVLQANPLNEDAGGTVWDVRFSDDGRHVLAGRAYEAEGPSPVAALDVYDASSHEHIQTLFGPRGIYETVDISGDGHVLATSFEPVTTSIWMPDDGDVPVKTHPDVYAAGFLTDRTLLASQPEDLNRLFEIDWTNGEVIESFPVGLEIDEVSLSPTGELVAVRDNVRRLAVYDARTGEEVMPPTRYTDPQAISWHPEGRLLALSGNDGDVTIVDPLTGATLMTLTGHDASVYATAWTPDGERIASLELGSGETWVWNVSPSGATQRKSIPVSEWGILDPIPTGGGFLRTVPGSHVEVLDLHGRVEATFHYEPLFPMLGVISGDGSVVGGEYGDGRSSIMDMRNGREVFLPECQSPRALSNDGSLAAIDTRFLCNEPDSRSGVFDLNTGDQLIETEEDHMFLATFSPDDHYVAVTSLESQLSNTFTLEVWRLGPTERLASISSEMIGEPFLIPRFSSDSRYLGVGSNGPAALVLDIGLMDSGASQDEFVVFNQEVSSGNTVRAIPTADGLLVTSAHDGFYRFWDIESGDFLMEIDVRGQIDVLSHGFSPDGSTLYYMQSNNLIAAIPTDADAMVDQVRDSLTRTLTEDECRQYLRTSGCP